MRHSVISPFCQSLLCHRHSPALHFTSHIAESTRAHDVMDEWHVSTGNHRTGQQSHKTQDKSHLILKQFRSQITGQEMNSLDYCTRIMHQTVKGAVCNIQSPLHLGMELISGLENSRRLKKVTRSIACIIENHSFSKEFKEYNNYISRNGVKHYKL